MSNFTIQTLNGATNAPRLGGSFTVPDVAEKLGLIEEPKGKGEFHGANPTGQGATEDGFILYADGNAYDRKLDQRYPSPEVAQMAGIEPMDYEPYRAFKLTNGDFSGSFPSGQKRGLEAVIGTPTAPQTAKNGKPDAKPTKVLNKQPLEERGISPEVLKSFGFEFEPTFKRYRYPTFTALGEVGRERFKNLDPEEAAKKQGADKPIKYQWNSQDKRPKGEGFGVREIEERFGLPPEIWLVGGEVDVLTMSEAGIPAVCTFGETQNPEPLIDALIERLGVERLNVALDNDTAGRTGTAKACKVAREKGIEPTLYALGGAEGRDINDLWNECGRDADKFKAALSLAKIEETPEPKTTAKFVLVSLSELSNRPPRAWVIEGVFHVESTALLTAKHASYKSFLALDMALCVATGQKWHGHEVTRGPVVYIAAEGGAGVIKRVKAWLQSHGMSDGRGNFQFPANFHVIERAVQFAESADLAEIWGVLAPLKAALIIVDTQARCSISLEENKTSDMSRFYDAIELLARRSGACVLCVHHNNKSGEYRGASSIPAAIDVHLSLSRSDDKERATLTFEKTKDDEEPAPMVFARQLVAIEGGGGFDHSMFLKFESDVQAGRYALSDTDERVLKQLTEPFGDTGATSSQWEKACAEAGMSGATFHRSRRKLRELKEVFLDGEEGKKGVKYRPTGQEKTA